MNGHGHEHEPRPPSYIPPVVIQERRNIWDFLKTFVKGCFLLVLLIFFAPIFIIFIPQIIHFFQSLFSNASLEKISEQVDVPDVWLKRYVFGIIAAIILGTIIRIIRKKI